MGFLHEYPKIVAWVEGTKPKILPMEYRRARITGGTYFFTLVTHHRRSFLCKSYSMNLLRRSFWYAMQRHPFAIDAAVILPEHLHCIWTLPQGDSDYSLRWRLIKSFFRGGVGMKCVERFQLQENIRRNRQSGSVDFGNTVSEMSRIGDGM
jgi:REP element-mobilizing transposase RayT